MDTSDESFVLTDASNDPVSEMEVENDDSGHESNYGEAYKEKLRLELSKTVKVEQEKKSKKQKRKTIVENHDIDENNFENKPIKSEPSSDFDIPKKKKRKHNESSNISFQDAEDYLNFRVKQEQVSFEESPSKKSKKKKKCKEEIETLENGDLEPTKIEDLVEENHLNNDSVSVNDNYENFNIGESDISHRKKKKKKKKRDSESHDSSISESLKDNNKIKKRKNNKSDFKEPHNGVQYEEEVNNDHSVISNLTNNSVNDTIVEQDDNNHNVTLLKGTETPRDKKNLTRTSRISDKIRFEEDSTSNDAKEDNSYVVPKELKQFLSTNSHLTPLISDACEDTAITENDEVWIVKGPHEICINDFENANLSLSGKAKVKLNGKTYDSFIDDSVNTATILSYNDNRSYVRNVPLMGIINLHKRIPRVHIPYEEVMVPDQESFIPLPETKCRHPLFGVNYKKATKIPADIVLRLNTEEALNDTVTKKKKHKKQKEKVEIESDIVIKQDESIQSTSSSKKKRKRKHSTEEFSSKKAKRVKQDPDNGEAWESEQAIEKNLFNF